MAHERYKKGTITWFSVEIKPEKDKFVLVNTRYCKFPITIGFWNGIEWRSADKAVLGNTSFWAEINYPTSEPDVFISTKKVDSTLKEVLEYSKSEREKFSNPIIT